MCLAGTSVEGEKKQFFFHEVNTWLVKIEVCFELEPLRCFGFSSSSCWMSAKTKSAEFLLMLPLIFAKKQMQLTSYWSIFKLLLLGSCYIWSELQNLGRMLHNSTARPLWCFINYCMSAWILPHSTLRYIAESLARSCGNGSLWMRLVICVLKYFLCVQKPPLFHGKQSCGPAGATSAEHVLCTLQLFA